MPAGKSIRRVARAGARLLPPEQRHRVRRTGGALLGDLDLALREQTGLAITVADHPLDCVAMGTGKALEFESQLRHVIDYDS